MKTLMRSILTPTKGGFTLGDLLWDSANSIPSLDLRFADNKSLVDATTGASLVTFTRASSGTFVGSDGVLRTAVTNLLLRSEEFDNASWTKSNSTITANAAIAPNGTLTADKLVENTANDQHIIYQSLSGTGRILSFYAKAAERTWVTIWGSGGGISRVDLTTGATGTAAPGATIVTQNVGDGWYRISVTDTNASFQVIGVAQSNATISYTGDGTSGIYFWGAQLEQSATAGEYIPTTSVINSAPRFDHNPTTGESLGLLVEEARTNLLLRSEAIATSPWFAGANTTLTNNTGEVLDPAGGSTATKVVVSGGTGAFGQPVTLTAAIHTGSIWLRCATGTISAQLIVYLGASPFTNIGTTSVTITTTFQRFSVVTSTATAAAYNLQLNSIAVGTVYAWGAQLEAGAFATSYIPTTTAAATRSADVASITGTAFSSWYRQDEGTVFVEYRLPAAGIGIATIDDGTANNIIPIFTGAGALQAASANAIVAGANSGRLDSGGSFVANSLTRAAYAIKVADRALSANGATATASATPSAMPVVTQLQIQGQSTFAALKGGTIKRLTFWPVRLANNILQSITQ